MILKLEDAKDLVSKEEPRGTKQVVIREWAGHSFVRVAIRRYLKKGKYREFSILPPFKDTPKPKTWAEALDLAIKRFEQQLKIQPGQPVALALIGDEATAWTRIKEVAPRLGIPVVELPDFLTSLCKKTQTRKEKHEDE